MNALPQSLQAEQALLGAIIFDNETMHRITPVLRAHHFYDPVHGRIFAACTEMIQAGALADGLTLKNRFAADGGLAQIGGAEYLMQLMDVAAPLSAQAQAYAELIVELAQRRALIMALREAEAEALAGQHTPADVQAALEARLYDVANHGGDGDVWAPLGDIVRDAIGRARKGEAKGISTGFGELDAMTNGLTPSLWFIGGATSMGKSVFAAALMRKVASQGFGVAEFHLEMQKGQIGLRTATALGSDQGRYGNPHYLSLARNNLTPEQWDKVRFGREAAASLPIWIDARPRRTIAQMESAARRLIRTWEREGRKPGAVLIDHEGLIAAEPGARFGSQLERTNARAEGLLAMQKNLGVPLVVLCQITKEGKRADGEERLPTIDDLKYGGALAEAADVALLLHRRAYYAERKPKHLRTPEDWETLKERDCTVIVDKARGGRRGQCSVIMDLPTAAVFEPGEVLS
jgi:replicative DNA helicase